MLELSDLIDVYEGDIRIKVRRGTDWPTIQALLEKEKTRLYWRKVNDNYFYTHGPLDQVKMKCLSCGKSFDTIHNYRSLCNADASAKARTE